MRECYELFRRVMPDYPTDMDTFCGCLKSAHFFYSGTRGSLKGFCAVNKGSITLLCVDSVHQNQGIGTCLLHQAEEYIRKNGMDTVTLGNGDNFLLQGVPEISGGFFEKHGYVSDWTSYNMVLEKNDFTPEKIHPAPLGTVFRLAKESDLPKLLDAVKAAEPEWLPLFEHEHGDVLIAEYNGELVGFEMLGKGSTFCGNEQAGYIGCVGVIPKARRQGIGLSMVAEGAARLFSNGCYRIELLYVELIDWYGRLGFVPVQPQLMMNKRLK